MAFVIPGAAELNYACLFSKLDDFVDVSETCSHNCISTSVIYGYAASLRIVECSARETYVRNISCALVESLWVEEVRTCSSDYLPRLVEVEEGSTE